MNNNTIQPTAVIFLRARYLGSDGRDYEQEQQQIVAQRAACEQRAEALRAQIIREYVEFGGTGSIDKRPVLRLMLDELRALHDAAYLIVTSFDRLARGVDESAAILLEIEASGAQLITASGVISPAEQKEVTV